ncbi:hypothetical protein MMC29_002205, partial [Sticta canariensis]|nr:hypothetical protein [Sticta canariensis]
MSVLRPQHDPYRSLPSTPIGIDPRNGSIDINSAMNHARLGLEVQDYFSGSPRFSGNLRPRSPYPHEYESESGAYTSNSSFAVSDMNPTNLAAFVNRTNLAVALVNAQISSTAKYGKVFPHISDDGTYPTDFSTAKTVETMRVLD